MDNWKGKTESCAAPQWWRLWLLVIIFMFLEAFIICIIGPSMMVKENPKCCPSVKSWHQIWNK